MNKEFQVFNSVSKSLNKCLLKRAYNTKKAALGAIARIKKYENYPLCFYKCPHCREFHLTKQIKAAQ